MKRDFLICCALDKLHACRADISWRGALPTRRVSLHPSRSVLVFTYRQTEVLLHNVLVKKKKKHVQGMWSSCSCMVGINLFQVFFRFDPKDVILVTFWSNLIHRRFKIIPQKVWFVICEPRLHCHDTI